MPCLGVTARGVAAGRNARNVMASRLSVPYSSRAAEEGKRLRWDGRASNPVGGATRRRVGSTPASFRPRHRHRHARPGGGAIQWIWRPSPSRWLWQSRSACTQCFAQASLTSPFQPLNQSPCAE